MLIENETVKAIFISRPNRFQAYIALNGEEIMVHVPNTGRCTEILKKGSTVILEEKNGTQRKTKYDLICGYKGDKIINIDSQIPNKVVYEALLNRRIEKLTRYSKIEKEKTYRDSRFDFLLSNENEKYYLEVKGVTLEDNGYALFPDAPTVRGTKHLLGLISAKKQGLGAGILFLHQMDGIKGFSPNSKMDRDFTNALIECKNQGVDIFAYSCKLSENFIELKDKIQIDLGGMEIDL
ncbi:MAG: DNA/RNA nuclease SfsA [Clostridiaceae bacterium]